MEENIKKTFDQINDAAVVITTSSQSLLFILKDLEEMETILNSEKLFNCMGIANIVEQLAMVIRSNGETIMELSDVIQ